MVRPAKAKTKADKIESDLRVLTRFIETYCRRRCQSKDGDLCEECRDLLAYARSRREKCPYDPKPKCKDCPTHCYKPEYRERIREVMRFSGKHFIMRGRLDWLIRYFR